MVALTQTLKPCPFKTASFSAACKARLHFAALAAPFDPAQARLLKPCPFKAESFTAFRMTPKSTSRRAGSVIYRARLFLYVSYVFRVSYR